MKDQNKAEERNPDGSKTNPAGGLGLPRRAAILARVSSDEQVDGTSLSSQVADCRERAVADGYVVDNDDIFVEEGVSGALPMEKRPQLAALFELIEAGSYQALFLYSPDRLSRDAINSLLYEKQASQAGAAVKYVTETYSDTDEGQMFRGFRAFISQYERALIARRTVRGRKSVWSRGKYGGGRIPYGYVWDADEGWLIDSPRAVIVRQIFDWYVSGNLSLREIVRNLNSQGIETPRQGNHWRDSSVRAIIRQPAYVGVYYGLRGKPYPQPQYGSIEEFRAIAQDRKWIPVPDFPAILVTAGTIPDVALWDAAQQMRSKKRHGGTGHRTLDWPLQGRMQCPECGRAIRCKKESNGRRRIYYCASRYEDNVGIDVQHCSTPRINAKEAELAVARALSRACGSPAAMQKIVEKYIRELRQEIETQSSRTGFLADDQPNLEKQLERLVTLFVEGSISLEQHQSRAAAINDRLQKIRNVPERKTLLALEEKVAILEEALAAGTLVARISPTRGMQLLRKKRNVKTPPTTKRGRPPRKAGIAGIESALYEDLVGSAEFEHVLGLLNIGVIVYGERIVISGSVPFDERQPVVGEWDLSDSDDSRQVPYSAPVITNTGTSDHWNSMFVPIFMQIPVESMIK